MEVPDPQHSRALLVGVSEYPRLPSDRWLPTVAAGLDRLAEVLCDDRVWGLPEGNCTVLHQPADSDTVVTALREAAQEARDALIFYYAGHGLVDPAIADEQLHLALPQSYEPGGTHMALSYAHVRREFRVNARQAQRRLVILDCCWSGKALGTTMGGDGIVGETAIEGTAVLTATAPTKKALAPDGEQYTAFTGALIDTLACGIEGGPELLDLGTIYRHLYAKQSGLGRPRPQFGGTGIGMGMTWTRNAAWQPSAQDNTAQHNTKQHNTAPDNTAQHNTAPDADTAARVRQFRRAGGYAEAEAVQQEAAARADPDAVRARVSELRRSGDYEQALRLEHTIRPD
jgi:hypothetical protein